MFLRQQQSQARHMGEQLAALAKPAAYQQLPTHV
jgi:hypothetical protein